MTAPPPRSSAWSARLLRVSAIFGTLLWAIGTAAGWAHGESDLELALGSFVGALAGGLVVLLGVAVWLGLGLIRGVARVLADRALRMRLWTHAAWVAIGLTSLVGARLLFEKVQLERAQSIAQGELQSAGAALSDAASALAVARDRFEASEAQVATAIGARDAARADNVWPLRVRQAEAFLASAVADEAFARRQLAELHRFGTGLCGATFSAVDALVDEGGGWALLGVAVGMLATPGCVAMHWVDPDDGSAERSARRAVLLARRAIRPAQARVEAARLEARSPEALRAAARERAAEGRLRTARAHRDVARELRDEASGAAAEAEQSRAAAERQALRAAGAMAHARDRLAQWLLWGVFALAMVAVRPAVAAVSRTRARCAGHDGSVRFGAVYLSLAETVLGPAMVKGSLEAICIDTHRELHDAATPWARTKILLRGYLALIEATARRVVDAMMERIRRDDD